jgi:ADP-ribose pyrophosphatase
VEKLKEETLSTSYLYRGYIVNVRQDRVRLPGGKTSFREVVEHPGAVAVLAIDENSCAVLVRQFRQPVGSILLEVPAGKLEPGEDPLTCARRELAEETGLSGASWTEAGWVYLSPGFCNEKIHLFITRGLSRTVAATADADEHIEVLRLPLAEAARLVETGEIIDAKTVLLLQKALLTSA